MLRGFELALIPLSVIAALIFIRVGADRPLWLDEADSIQFASQSLGGALESLRNDVNLPAYYLILHPWIALFGDSETAARSLSGLLYLATIGVVFQTGRFLFSDRRSAFYCAFFFLISMQAIRNAQNIRSYALLGFLASVSIFFCLRLLRSTDAKFRDCMGLVLVNAAGSFTHMWFFFILAAEFAACLFCAPRKVLRGMILAGLSVLPFATLWLQPFLNQVGNGANASLNSFMPVFHWTFLPETLLQYYGGGVIAGLYFYIIYALLFRSLRNRSFSAFLREPSVRLLMILFGTAILVSMTVCFFKPIYLPGRYTIIALPALATLLGAMLARCANRALSIAFCYGLLVWTTVAHIQTRNVNVVSGWRSLQGQSDKSTAQFIAQDAKKGDVVVFTSLSRLPVDYYLKRYGFDSGLREVSFPAEIDKHPSWRDVNTMLKNRPLLEAEAERAINDWEHLALQNRSSIWVLYGRDLAVSDILKQKLDRRFSLVQRVEVGCPFHTFVLKYTKPFDSVDE